MYLEFLEETEGKSIVELEDLGFFAYTISPQGEMHVSHLFIQADKRNMTNCNEMAELIDATAKVRDAKVITAVVFMKHDGKRFLQRLNLFSRFGFVSQYIENNAVVLMKEL